ncbi:hypothetical protein [Bacillus sp. X1(2014)]|uniref:hypothetical protein n=1 Tax=Bacillus sp. X1(2014) TaxID=1565991 RepID=UPI0011A90A11|nr:hypothetical protein [Bacillus sp. X1(2014)]
MATLRTGPFFIPNFVHLPPNPCNIVVLTFSNQTNQTLTVIARVDQVFYPPSPLFPPHPIVPLIPPSPFTLPPNTSTRIIVPLFPPIPIAPDSTDTETATTPLGGGQALIVTVSGDIVKSGDLIQASVTGGFSDDNTSLDFSEATMFFRHDDFVEVNDDDDDDDESSDERSSSGD